MSNKIYLILFVLYPITICIFCTPDLTKTSNKFNTYTIDFRGIDTPPSTYWSLANYHLDLTDFEKTHSEVSGGGAYGGLQTLYSGEKVAIMSFWKINYKENGEVKTLKFNRIYPEGEEMDFSGEGEGTTYRAHYEWKTNSWYRFVLHTWDDVQTKNTFIGQWIQDLDTKEWTLFSYFNTNLNNSFIGGGNGALGFFQEIFSKTHLKYDRSFQLRNMYVFDRTNKKWNSINTAYLSYGENPELYIDVGYTQFYFYGTTIPRKEGVDYQNGNNNFSGSISQPITPTFNKPEIKKLNVEHNSSTNKLNIEWEIDSTTCPCYKYDFKIETKTETGYMYLYSNTITRPEVSNHSLTLKTKGTIKITFTATALSNESVTKEITKTI